MRRNVAGVVVSLLTLGALGACSNLNEDSSLQGTTIRVAGPKQGTPVEEEPVQHFRPGLYSTGLQPQYSQVMAVQPYTVTRGKPGELIIGALAIPGFLSTTATIPPEPKYALYGFREVGNSLQQKWTTRISGIPHCLTYPEISAVEPLSAVTQTVDRRTLCTVTGVDGASDLYLVDPVWGSLTRAPIQGRYMSVAGTIGQMVVVTVYTDTAVEVVAIGGDFRDVGRRLMLPKSDPGSVQVHVAGANVVINRADGADMIWNPMTNLQADYDHCFIARDGVACRFMPESPEAPRVFDLYDSKGQKNEAALTVSARQYGSTLQAVPQWYSMEALTGFLSTRVPDHAPAQAMICNQEVYDASPGPVFEGKRWVSKPLDCPLTMLTSSSRMLGWTSSALVDVSTGRLLLPGAAPNDGTTAAFWVDGKLYGYSWDTRIFTAYVPVK